jgi:hypothetical protein
LAEETADGPTVINAAYIEEEVNRHLQIEDADATVSGEGKDRHGNRQRSEGE